MTRPDSDRGHLLTEQAHPLSESLDELSTAEMVALFCQNDLEPQRAVAAAAPQLTAAVDAISDRLRHGGRLFIWAPAPLAGSACWMRPNVRPPSAPHRN